MGTSHSPITVPFFGLLLCAPISAQVVQRVSVGTGGGQSDYRTSSAVMPASADGRFVAFLTVSPDLVPGDTNNWVDVFVRDRQDGTTERVSVASDGTQSNGNIEYFSISADGRYVAFNSNASVLVPGDTNGVYDVFVRDRQNGTLERVSVDSSGVQGNGYSGPPAISADGRYVAFRSWSYNFFPGDQIGTVDAFVHDRETGATELVGRFVSPVLSISADGRFVAFDSSGALVPGDTNNRQDIFVRDRQSGTLERVSVASDGTQGNDSSYSPSISADGRYVAFESYAYTLVPGDTNGTDVFVRDRQNGTTERVSVQSGGAQATGGFQSGSISADGRWVAFTSNDSSLVPGDTNDRYDVFVHDRQTVTTERVSINWAGAETNGESFTGSLSSDGRYVVFVSNATNVVPGDTNDEFDAFVYDRNGGPAFTSLCDPGVGGVQVCPCANPPAGPGRGCDNSALTGGANLAASGGTFLSSDSLVFTTSGEKPTALSTVWQGPATPASGIVYGQGVRCANGSLKRLYSKAAVGGSITAPNFGAGDLSVSARSAALGAPILPGGTRYYFVSYRDPTVLGGCPSSSTFNATQTGAISWSP